MLSHNHKRIMDAIAHVSEQVSDCQRMVHILVMRQHPNIDPQLLRLTKKLQLETDELQAAIDGQTAGKPTINQRRNKMASPVLDQLTAQVTETTGVEASAVALINGFQARLDEAVAAALANGATAEELQPLSDLSTAMEEQTTALAAAIAAQPPPGP